MVPVILNIETLSTNIYIYIFFLHVWPIASKARNFLIIDYILLQTTRDIGHEELGKVEQYLK